MGLTNRISFTAVMLVLSCSLPTNTSDARELRISSTKPLCWAIVVEGRSRVICAQWRAVIGAYQKMYGKALTDRAQDAIARLMAQSEGAAFEKILASNKPTILCGRSGAAELDLNLSATVGATPAAPVELQGSDLSTALKKCGDVLDRGTGVRLGTGWKGAAGSTSYQDAVARTKARMTESANNCKSGPGATVMNGWSGVFGIGGFMKAYGEAVYRTFAEHGDFAKGSQDAFAGKPPDTNGSDSYMKGYGETVKGCQATGADSCKKLLELYPPKKDEAPEKQAKTAGPPEGTPPGDYEPPPDTENPPTFPDDDDDRTALASCIDESCSSYCENKKRRTAWIIRTCDAANWQTFECKNWVNSAGNCADSTRVNPTPDGDIECRSPETSEQQKQRLWKEACEKKGQVAAFVKSESGIAFQCNPLPSRVAPLDAFNERMRQQCIFMLTDGGICGGEQPIVAGSGQVPPGGGSPSPPYEAR